MIYKRTLDPKKPNIEVYIHSMQHHTFTAPVKEMPFVGSVNSLCIAMSRLLIALLDCH